MYTSALGSPSSSISSQPVENSVSALQEGNGAVAIGLGDLPRDVLSSIKLELYHEINTLRELTLASKAVRSLFTAEEHQFIKLDAQLTHLCLLIKQNGNDKLNNKVISAFSAIVAKAEALLNQAELSQSQPQLMFTLLNWLAVQNAERYRLRVLLSPKDADNKIVDQADILKQYSESCELLIDKAWHLLTNEQLYQQRPGLAYQVVIFLTDVKYFRITEEECDTLRYTEEADYMLASGRDYDVNTFKTYFKLIKALPYKDAGYQAVKLFLMTFSFSKWMSFESAEHVPEVFNELFGLPITLLEAYKARINDLFDWGENYETDFPDPLALAISKLLALEPIQKLIELGASVATIDLYNIGEGISKIGHSLGARSSAWWDGLDWFEGVPLRDPVSVITWCFEDELFEKYESTTKLNQYFKYLLKAVIAKYKELADDLVTRAVLKICCDMIIQHPKFIVDPENIKDKQLISEIQQLVGDSFIV